MVFHINASCCLSSASASFDVFTPSSFSIRMFVFLAMFLMHGDNTAVEGKSFSTRIHRNVTILSRTGKYLTVDHRGVIGKDFYSPNGKLQLHTAGFKGQIKIMGLLTGKYLAMNSTGKISLVSDVANAAEFYDLRNIDGYVSYRSTTYSTRYLTVSGTGHVSGSTNRNTDDSKFAVFPAF